MQAVRKQFVEPMLPAVVHVMPAAAEGNRENLFLDQQLRQRVIKVVKTFIEGKRLIPPKLSIAVVVCPFKGVIMQRQLVAKLLCAVAMILFH